MLSDDKSTPETDLNKSYSLRRLAVIVIVLGISYTLYHIWNVLPAINQAATAPIFPTLPHVNVTILYIHIATAVPPLVLGFIAFLPQLRKAKPSFHRWIGTIYCVSIWISALTGISLASANTVGILAQFGFGTLGVMWYVTTLKAYVSARNKDFFNHRRWMLRSYALTLAVVSVRPMFGFGPPSFLSSVDWYLLVTWICWVPNLLAAEIYLRCTDINGKFQKPEKLSFSLSS